MDLAERSLNLEPQTPWTLLPVLCSMQIDPTPNSGKHFSNPTERRDLKLWDSIGSNEVHQVSQFEPNLAVEPEVITTLENHPLKPEVGNFTQNN